MDSESLNKFEEKLSERSNAEDHFVPAAITDPGCDRELNEDRYAVIESHSGLMWLVCDGMGGVKGGELAAQLVIDSIKRYLDNSVPLTPEDALTQTLSEANRVVVLRRQNQAFAQMGTTATAAFFNDRQVTIASIGDSRAYIVTPDSIKQLSEDHTYVQELVKSGEINEEEALSHPQAHVLTRAIGAEPSIEIENHTYWIWDVDDPADQDYLVLVTDGLYSLVTDDEMADSVRKNPPQVCCTQLVEIAKQRGGYDNITIAVIPLVGKFKNTPPDGYEAPVPTMNVEEEEQINLSQLRPVIIKNLLMIIGLSIIALVVAVILVLLAISS